MIGFMMRPLQVYLDDDDLDRLESWARHRGWSKSQAVRIAIRALTRAPAADPLIELSGDIDGLPEDISANFNRYLSETFVAELLPYRARRGRPRSALRR
jgi:Ribbon-helix-helix protein, copG family